MYAIMSLRDGSTSIHTLNLNFEDPAMKLDVLLPRIIKYAVSHNIQHLQLNYNCHIQHFPSCVFSCHTLTSLHLCAHKRHICSSDKAIFPNSLNWPALTTLYLKNFAFVPSHDGCAADPFSGLKMLNTLTIDHCLVCDVQNLLCISSAKLVNLSIVMWELMVFYFGLELYAPSLHSFTFTGPYTLNIFWGNNVFSSVKQVSIDLCCYYLEQRSQETSPRLLDLLVKFANIESLTFYSNTLEVLSSVPDLLKVEFRSLHNLKSLKMTRPNPCSTHFLPPYETVAFLMQNSLSAKFDIIPNVICSNINRRWNWWEGQRLDLRKLRLETGLPSSRN